MDLLKTMLRVFVYVIAGITISSATFIMIFIPEAQLTYHILWQIIGISAVCALGTVIYQSKKELSKRSMKIRIIFHYLYINLIVFSGAFLFEWVQPKILIENIFLFISIAVVFVCVMAVMFRQEEKRAKELNIRLREIQDKKEDQEE